METKTCSECKIDFSIENFIWKTKERRHNKCGECRRAGQRLCYYKYQKKNLDRVKNRNKLLRKEIQILVDDLKSSLSCLICKEKEPCCLDFHHKNPKEKDYNIGSMKNRFSKEIILEEIKKCVVLCSNCHRKFHKGIILPQW